MFRAECPPGCSPAKLPKRIYGEHSSEMVDKKTRRFSFDTEAARDKFVAEHQRAGARAIS